MLIYTHVYTDVCWVRVSSMRIFIHSKLVLITRVTAIKYQLSKYPSFMFHDDGSVMRKHMLYSEGSRDCLLERCCYWWSDILMCDKCQMENNVVEFSVYFIKLYMNLFIDFTRWLSIVTYYYNRNYNQS